MTLYGFVLRSLTGTLFRVRCGEAWVRFDGETITCVKAEVIDNLLGEWSALAHRQVLRFAPGCSNGVPYMEVTICPT